MKKTRLLLSMVIVAGLIFTGCSNTSKNEADNNSKSSSEDSSAQKVSLSEVSEDGANGADNADGAETPTPDYAEADFEAALNNGEDLTGKTVQFTVSDIEPASAFGYNLMAGEHLNFVNSDNQNANVGETYKCKVTAVQSVVGSWVISYENLQKIE